MKTTVKVEGGKLNKGGFRFHLKLNEMRSEYDIPSL